MKFEKYLMNEDVIALANEYGLVLDDNLGTGIKRSIEKKRDEIIKAMAYIKDLALKTTKTTKDKTRIKSMEKEMKEAEKELEDVIDNINDTLNYVFYDS